MSYILMVFIISLIYFKLADRKLLAFMLYQLQSRKSNNKQKEYELRERYLVNYLNYWPEQGYYIIGLLGKFGIYLSIIIFMLRIFN